MLFHLPVHIYTWAKFINISMHMHKHTKSKNINLTKVYANYDILFLEFFIKCVNNNITTIII